MTLRIAVPDLVFPVTKTCEMLRDGALDLADGSAHAALYAFPDWQGGRLVCALAQQMYWFLVMHASLGAARGDLGAVRGRRIGAAPGPVDGLKGLLAQAGIDPAQDATIGPVPGTIGGSGPVSFGLMAAKALEERKIDGFWANGTGAELAVRGGYGSVVIDAGISRETFDRMNGFAASIGLATRPARYEDVVVDGAGR
jgi:hypothetical protein